MRPDLRSRGRRLAARPPFAEFRVDDLAPVAVREPEVEARAAGVVELVLGLLLAQPVALVLGEPEILRARIPVEADDLADTPRERLEPAAVQVHADELCVGGRGGRAGCRRGRGG